MSGRTSHYGWSTMQSGDLFSDDGYKYTFTDRTDMDQQAWMGAEGHHHLGGIIAVAAPAGPPSLTRSSSGGLIPASTRVYYKISLVNFVSQESVASAEAFIDTPAAVATPGPPTPTQLPTTGSLQGGDYYYAVSAYVSASATETLASTPIFLTVPSTTATNKITLTLPSVPSGATGFNVYRRAPGETRFYFLASVATPAATYVDNGSVAENCDRTIPNANTTNSSNSIVITYPGATPVVPVGYTWNIYRTYTTANYTSSLLKQVIEWITQATPLITPSYTDTGISTGSGSPLATVPTRSNPDKINLVTEVQGTLPLGLTAFPFEITFDFPGDTFGPTTGIAVWPCEYTGATIIGCRASLGAGKTASGPVIVDVKKGPSSATPTFTSIYTTVNNRPIVQTGQTRSLRTAPNTKTLVAGDLLTADVITVGGATPLVQYLTVTVYGIAHSYPTDTAFVPGTTTGA